MIGKISKIVAYDEKRKSTELKEAQLTVGKGLPQDRHYDSDGEPISLWFLPRGMTSFVSWPPERHRKGICTSKFKANLIIDTSDSGGEDRELIPGDSIQVGNATLTIQTKKPCYADCPLVKSGDTCALKDNAYFASVAKTGMIHLHDGIKK